MIYARPPMPFETVGLKKVLQIRRDIVVMSAGKMTVAQVAQRLDLHEKTVRKWINLWNDNGLEGLTKVIPRTTPYQRRGRGGLRGIRSPTVQAVYDYIGKHPDSTVYEIHVALEMDRKKAKSAIQSLRNGGRIVGGPQAEMRYRHV